MTMNASRAPIDFDAFECELQETSSPRTESSIQPKNDPLAELARIVGQDDPFRALLAARGGEPSAAPQTRIEPSFFEAPREAEPDTPADAFDRYLASVEQSEHETDDFQDPAAFEADDTTYLNAASARPRQRGKLLQVGAGLGLLVLCVTGALSWKGLRGGSGNGEPVTVLADKSPLKVAPEKADGVDIPDQNKQIYDRNAKDGQIKVVNREEQPLDVSQVARSAAATDQRGAAGQGGVTPGGTGLLTESLGQPRRIRTVAVKPDTPPPAPQRDPEPSSAAPSPIPTMTMPDASAGAAATPLATPRSPSRSLASTPAPVRPEPPVQVAEASAPEQPAPVPAPAPRKAVQRVASVAPETTASTAQPEVKPAPAPSPAAAVRGFFVQIGVRDSEADAHAAFRQMQAKYAQLAGKPELIRQAEVNGKSIYRVRVGPLAKNEAASLCTELKGAGGQCYTGKN